MFRWNIEILEIPREIIREFVVILNQNFKNPPWYFAPSCLCGKNNFTSSLPCDPCVKPIREFVVIPHQTFQWNEKYKTSFRAKDEMFRWNIARNS